MVDGDVDLLRRSGWSEDAIVAATHVVGIFNYLVRLADAFGIEWEPEVAGLRHASAGALEGLGAPSDCRESSVRSRRGVASRVRNWRYGEAHGRGHQRKRPLHAARIDLQRRARRLVQRIRPSLESRARRRNQRGSSTAARGVEQRVRGQGVGHPQPPRGRQARHPRSRRDAAADPPALERGAVAALRDFARRGAPSARAGAARAAATSTACWSPARTSSAPIRRSPSRCSIISARAATRST